MDHASTDKTPRWTDTRQIQDSEVLTLIKTQKSGKFVPGSRWSYSNSGYVLLGLIVAQVSGEPFAESLRERQVGRRPNPSHRCLTRIDGCCHLAELGYHQGSVYKSASEQTIRQNQRRRSAFFHGCAGRARCRYFRLQEGSSPGGFTTERSGGRPAQRRLGKTLLDLEKR